MQKYILFVNDAATLIDMPSNASSEDYGQVQIQFEKIAGHRDDWAMMLPLHSYAVRHGVHYHEELAGPDGARFMLFMLPENTPEQMEAAESTIRRESDVVRLRRKKFVRWFSSAWVNGQAVFTPMELGGSDHA